MLWDRPLKPLEYFYSDGSAIFSDQFTSVVQKETVSLSPGQTECAVECFRKHLIQMVKEAVSHQFSLAHSTLNIIRNLKIYLEKQGFHTNKNFKYILKVDATTLEYVFNADWTHFLFGRRCCPMRCFFISYIKWQSLGTLAELIV